MSFACAVIGAPALLCYGRFLCLAARLCACAVCAWQRVKKCYAARLCVCLCVSWAAWFLLARFCAVLCRFVMLCFVLAVSGCNVLQCGAVWCCGACTLARYVLQSFRRYSFVFPEAGLVFFAVCFPARLYPAVFRKYCFRWYAGCVFRFRRFRVLRLVFIFALAVFVCSKLARCIRLFVFCSSKCKLFRARLLAGAPALLSALISCGFVPLFGCFVPQQVPAQLFYGSWRYLNRFFVLKTLLFARLQNFRRYTFIFPEALRSFTGLFPRFLQVLFRFRLRFFWRFLRFPRFSAGSSSAVRLFFRDSAVFIPPKLTARFSAAIFSGGSCFLFRALPLAAAPALVALCAVVSAFLLLLVFSLSLAFPLSLVAQASFLFSKTLLAGFSRFRWPFSGTFSGKLRAFTFVLSSLRHFSRRFSPAVPPKLTARFPAAI